MNELEQLRLDFHRFLIENGFAEPKMNQARTQYLSSHIALLWLCYQQATLDERARSQKGETQ